MATPCDVAMASRMAAIVSGLRPSEKLGTHSTSFMGGRMGGTDGRNGRSGGTCSPPHDEDLARNGMVTRVARNRAICFSSPGIRVVANQRPQVSEAPAASTWTAEGAKDRRGIAFLFGYSATSALVVLLFFSEKRLPQLPEGPCFGPGARLPSRIPEDPTVPGGPRRMEFISGSLAMRRLRAQCNGDARRVQSAMCSQGSSGAHHPVDPFTPPHRSARPSAGFPRVRLPILRTRPRHFRTRKSMESRRFNGVRLH